MNDNAVRVLIVEASADIRALQTAVVRKAFEGLELETVDASTVAAALEPFGRDPFHLLLVDVTVHSEDLTQLIRQSRMKQRCPTIAFTTGRIDRPTLEMLANDHVFSIFPKPFDPSEVAAAIRESYRAHSASVDAVISPILHGILKHLHFGSTKD